MSWKVTKRQRFAVFKSLGDPAQREGRLSDARRPHDEAGITLSHPAGHQPLQARDTAADPAGDRCHAGRDECFYPGEDLDAVRVDLEGVPAWHAASAAHLDDAHRPPVDWLPDLVLQLDDAVGQGELDTAAQFLGGVLTHQQQHRAGIGETAGQVVQTRPRRSRSSAKSRSILALSTTTTAGSSSSVFLTISETSGSSPSGRAGRRKSPRWMCSTREPSEPLSKKENCSRCLTSLVSRLGHGRVVDALMAGGPGGEADLLGEDRLAGPRRARHHHDRAWLQAAVEDHVKTGELR